MYYNFVTNNESAVFRLYCDFKRNKIVSKKSDHNNQENIKDISKLNCDNSSPDIDTLSKDIVGTHIVGIDYKIKSKEKFNDVTGEFCFKKFMAIDSPCKFCPIKNVLKDSKAHSVQISSNDENYYEFILTPIFNDSGNIDSVIEVIIDRTASEKAEKALKEEQSFIRAALNAHPDTIFVFDIATGKAIRWNKAFSFISGYTDEEIKHLKAPDSYYSKDDLTKMSFIIKEMIKDKVTTIELSLLTKDGRSILMEYTASAVKDSENKPKYIISIGRDISERKLNDLELQESEARYRAIVEDQTEFIVQWLPDGTRTFANESYCRYYGLDRKQVAGKSFFPLISTEDLEKVKKRISLLSPENPVSTDEHSVILPDGTKGWNQWTDRGIFDETGKLIKLQSVGHDITDYKITENILSKTVARFQNLVEVTNDLIWEIDINGKYVYVSPQIYNILGYNPEEVIGKTIFDFMLKEESDRVLNVFNKVIVSKDKINKFEIINLHKNGDKVYLEMNAIPVFDINNNLIGYFGGNRDISERKKFIENLMKEKDLAENYLNVVGVMVLGLDSKKEVIVMNRKGAEILGYTKEEVIGKNWFDNFIPERLREEIKVVSDKLFKGEIAPVEYYENPILTKSGQERIIAWHNVVLRDDTGKIIAHLSSGDDITDRKIAEKQIVNLAKFPAQNPSPVLRVNLDGIILYANNASQLLLESCGCAVGSMMPVFWKTNIEDSIKNNSMKIIEENVYDKIFEFVIAPAIDMDYINIYGRDVTDRKKLEKSLKEALNEKEILLQEVHHRVKNNLVVLQGLVEIQQLKFKNDPVTKEALEKTKLRINAMGKVHQFLYQSKSLSNIDFSAYIRNVVHELSLAFYADERNINISFDLEPINLDIKIATPCGLILNELFLNVFKYAFLDGDGGRVYVSLKKKNGKVELIIKDNGIGMSDDFNFGNIKTLGLKLVVMFTRQINGEIHYKRNNGSEFLIRFDPLVNK